MKIYRLSDNKQICSSTSSIDDPETLSYDAPTTGNYKIVAYAYTPGSQVGLNAVVIKKKNGKYIFD